jgi:catechol 2,3-dioxygenase-like lactoylglutathione lyase family enzyme
MTNTGDPMPDTAAPFELAGVHHLALVTSDMARTVAFYRDLLGLRLIKSIDLPVGMGQHFFFDVGNGDTLAFFYFAEAPAHVDGASSPTALPLEGDFRSAPGSMNHVALKVAPERIDEYRAKLVGLGIHCTEIASHDESEFQLAEDPNDEGVWLRSIYFFDPDGHQLELAAWARPLTEADVLVDPMNARGERVPLDALPAPLG